MKNIRRTKIVATLGPASDSKEKITELIDAGVNVFRLNGSHGDHSQHLSSINFIKEVREEKKLSIGILFDLQGPKIRVGKLENSAVTLIEGQQLTIVSDSIIGSSSQISTNYPNLYADVNIGDKILLDDGIFILEVVCIQDKNVVTKVIAGGILKDHKGVNIPGKTNSLSAISEKDQEDIVFAVQNKVDFIALSFVRTKDDILLAREHICKFNCSIPLIAKIEKPQALDNILEIIEVSDGIMVARGDLGIELASEKVPLAQKKLIHLANKMNKFVITATQMLDSMVNNPLPSRAEASDVANAILDGTHAIMLSQETSVGKYPVKSVQMMDKIAREIEYNSLSLIRKSPPESSKDVNADSHSIGLSISDMSEDLNPSAVVVFTGTGYSARLLSNFKTQVPIIAVTPSEDVYHLLSIYWGVIPYVLDIDNFNEELINTLNDQLKTNTDLDAGDKVIITGGMPYLVTGYTNFIRIHTLP